MSANWHTAITKVGGSVFSIVKVSVRRRDNFYSPASGIQVKQNKCINIKYKVKKK